MFYRSYKKSNNEILNAKNHDQYWWMKNKTALIMLKQIINLLRGLIIYPEYSALCVFLENFNIIVIIYNFYLLF